jgi:hypothetical protein
MKLFTVEEANALLPELRRLMAGLDRTRSRLRQLEPEARRAAERATESGGTPFGIEYARVVARSLVLTQQVLGLGVEIKDFEQGLCDFPHLRGGRIVYLCWKKGEPRIEWWHDVEAGFAGRQPL